MKTTEEIGIELARLQKTLSLKRLQSVQQRASDTRNAIIRQAIDRAILRTTALLSNGYCHELASDALDEAEALVGRAYQQPTEGVSQWIN